MICKKFLLSALVGSAFLLGACGDDNPNSPDNPTPSSALIPLPTSSSAIDPGPTSSPIPTSSTPAPASSAVAPVVYPQLAPAANPTVAMTHYLNWRSFHYTTEEQEMAIYPSLAVEFSNVFPAAYVYDPVNNPLGGVGRVIWQNQANGYYRDFCYVEDAADASWRARACTVSEGIGYGMLLAYFNQDDETFRRLWNYTRGFRVWVNRRLMPWITESFYWREVDNSSATDADEDIATALILMYYRTGQDMYLQDALNFVSAIWDLEVNPTTLLLYSGDEGIWKKANPTYNLSYFSPVALRLFAMVDPSHDWMGVLNAMYTYMQNVQAMGTGVFPDWSDATGNAVNPPNESAGKNEKTYTWYTFNKESVRIPWRIAWDYYWFQDPRAATILTQLNQFISTRAKNNPDDAALSVYYSWNLAIGPDNTKGTTVPSHWYGAWCVTGIVDNPTWLSLCTNGVNAKILSNTGSSYFPDILLSMYSALLNGLFIRPF